MENPAATLFTFSVIGTAIEEAASTSKALTGATEMQFCRSGAFVGLCQVPVDEDAISRWTQSRQKELPLLFNHDVVAFLVADGQFITLGEAEGEHAKVFHRRLSIDTNLEGADHLVE